MKVCLDAGHGGQDAGAHVPGGRPEKESNLRVALKVESRLRTQGLDVLMTRSDDSFVSLTERSKGANRWGADIFVSLHADSAGGPAPQGQHAIHTIHHETRPEGKRLALLLVEEVEKATGRTRFPAAGSFFGGPGDGTWSRRGQSDPTRDYYGVIRLTKMPAVILERGFLSNPQDARLLFDDAFLSLQAEGISRGIYAFFGIPRPGDPPPPGGTSSNLPALREEIARLKETLAARDAEVTRLKKLLGEIGDLATQA